MKKNNTKKRSRQKKTRKKKKERKQKWKIEEQKKPFVPSNFDSSRSTSHFSAVDSDWIVLRTTFFLTLHSFMKYFPSTEQSLIQAFLERVITGSVFDAMTKEEVESAFRTCLDTKFCEVIHTLISPCIGLLFEKMENPKGN